MLAEDFLKEYQQELIAKKMEKSEELDLIKTKMRENEKFLDLLLEEEKNVFSDFSPREIASKNTNKINEVKEELFYDGEKRENLEKDISFLDNKIEEINKIFETELNPLHNLKGNYSRLGINSGQAKQLLESLDAKKEDGEKAGDPFDENDVDGKEDNKEDNKEDKVELKSEGSGDNIDDIRDDGKDSDDKKETAKDDIDNPENDERNYIDEQKSVAETFYLEMMNIVNTCKQIDGYILSDPMRGKVELKQVSLELENITKLLE